MSQWLLLDSLTLSDTYRIREHLDEDAIERYAGILASLPPVKVARMDGKLYLIDGFHRVGAARRKGENGLMADVMEVTEDVAFEMAVKANVLHGLPLRARERRRAAIELLRRFPQRTDRWIAEDAGMDSKTVNSIRLELAGNAEIPHCQFLVGKDGRRWDCTCDACQPKPQPVKEDPWADVNMPAIEAEPEPEPIVEKPQPIRMETRPAPMMQAPPTEAAEAQRSEAAPVQEPKAVLPANEPSTPAQSASVSHLGDKRADLRRNLFNPLVRIKAALDELEAGDFHEEPIDWIDEAMDLLREIEGRSQSTRNNLRKIFDWKKEREPLANKVVSLTDRKRA